MSGPGSNANEPLQVATEAAVRAKVAAGQSAGWLRDEATRLFSNYKAQSKFFKWRSWIVGGYALVAVVSIFMASGPIQTIDAYVIPSYDVSSREFMVSVKNESSEEWTNVRLVLDGDFVFEQARLTPGQSVLAKVTQFQHRGGNTRAPASLRPQKLKVDADQGSYRVAVAGE